MDSSFLPLDLSQSASTSGSSSKQEDVTSTPVRRETIECTPPEQNAPLDLTKTSPKSNYSISQILKPVSSDKRESVVKHYVQENPRALPAQSSGVARTVSFGERESVVQQLEKKAPEPEESSLVKTAYPGERQSVVKELVREMPTVEHVKQFESGNVAKSLPQEERESVVKQVVKEAGATGNSVVPKAVFPELYAERDSVVKDNPNTTEAGSSDIMRDIILEKRDSVVKQLLKPTVENESSTSHVGHTSSETSPSRKAVPNLPGSIGESEICLGSHTQKDDDVSGPQDNLNMTKPKEPAFDNKVQNEEAKGTPCTKPDSSDSTVHTSDATLVEQGEVKHHKVIQGEAEHHEVVQREATNHEVVQGEAKHHEVIQGEAKHLEVVQGEAKRHEIVQGEAKHQEVVQGEAKHHEVVQGEAKHHEIVQGEAKHHEVVQGEAKHHEVVHEEAKHHEVVEEGEPKHHEVAAKGDGLAAESHTTHQTQSETVLSEERSVEKSEYVGRKLVDSPSSKASVNEDSKCTGEKGDVHIKADQESNIETESHVGEKDKAADVEDMDYEETTKKKKVPTATLR